MSALPADATIPMWARCAKCGHTWIACYLPQLVDVMCKILKRAICPKCAGRAMIAKQSDGQLLEQSDA